MKNTLNSLTTLSFAPHCGVVVAQHVFERILIR
jgi:hypothetical protein